MKKSQKELLEEKALRASRIQHTLSTNGWKDIQDIIENKYISLMGDLLAKDNSEARGGINALIDIMNDISIDLKFGENARDKYKRMFLTPQE